MRAGVAAGHPATAAAGAEILADGGTAADAVVAMALASCVAETVMSGLLAGCHAIAFDGTRVAQLDGFAAVPAASGDLVELEIPFGDEPVVYAIGAGSCAVPGLPAALGELWERMGRLPWQRLCEPALALARSGVRLPEMHARTLEMLGGLLSLERGAALYTRDGRTLGEDETLVQPGLVETLEALTEEGAASVYGGSLAEALLAVDGVVLRAADLASYRPHWRDAVVVEYAGRRVATRGGLSGVPQLLPRLPTLGDLTGAERVLALVRALEPSPVGGEHTTNMVAVDGHGRACVLTHSLGVGAGVWLPGFDVQLNNLLGESDIAHGEPAPGDHLESRMAPTLAFDANGLELAIGAAGATRLRTALATVLAAILDEGLDAETAVGLPRVHPISELVDAEPGVDETALTELEEGGRTVRRWDRLHHYFGGVSCVGRAGAAGDPRRSGAALLQ
jgi:gamma-glutamyltranspeptidase/glutathione hydrolase